MIRVYNLSHPAIGKPVLGNQTILFNIPPIGEYVEIDPKHHLKVQNVIDNSYGRFSYTPTATLAAKQTNVVIGELQEQLDAAKQAQETMQAQNEELMKRLAELEAKVAAPDSKTKKKVEE